MFCRGVQQRREFGGGGDCGLLQEDMLACIDRSQCLLVVGAIRAGDVDGVDIAVCPTFVSLFTIAAALNKSNIMLGAQDTFWKESGAWTRQIAPGMLKDVGCQWVIVGHSETRGRFGTVDEMASLICWLASEESSFSTGAVFDLSGGRATY